MSVSINGSTIKMTRGDTLIVQLDIWEDASHTTPYEPDPEDVIRFAVKHPAMKAGRTDYMDAAPVLSKVIPNDSLILQINPADTKTLDFGEYVYDVQITMANGVVDTFITPSPFIIAPEVD